MNRRRFLTGTGGLLVASSSLRAWAEGSDELAYPSDACQAVTQQTLGPFLTDSPLRSDIREGLPGVPLRLRFQIVDDMWCKPTEGAVVNIWHCDAIGRYSNVENINFDRQTLRVTGMGLDLRGQQFLRGHQVSDAEGRVEFLTIFPGWYVPRLAHIHVQVIYRDIGWTETSTQLYLPQAVEQEVYGREGYAARGQNPIDARRDLVIKGNQEVLDSLTVAVQPDGEGFVGDYQIATVAL